MEKKVLVVDDEPAMRTLLEDAFCSAGYDVRLAENSEEALTQLEQEHIRVIFLDLKLFGMNGIELCRTIRKRDPLAILYAVTGWAPLFAVAECREAGFDDYFTKPIRLATLYKALEDAFEKLERWGGRYEGVSPLTT